MRISLGASLDDMDANARSILWAKTSADVAYLALLSAGLFKVLILQFSLGLYVYFLCAYFPKGADRRLRMSLGLPGIVATAFFASKIFDPSQALLGAVGAATLVAFNTPLRCFQLLSSPPVRLTGEQVSRNISTLRFALALVAVPTAANWDNMFVCAPKWTGSDDMTAMTETVAQLSIKRRNQDDEHRKPPVACNLGCSMHAVAGICSACVSFAVASGLCHFVPDKYILKHPCMMILVTFATSGFATISTSIFGLITGIPIRDAFFYPWLAPSLASFWAYRWNAPIASALRSGVFEPVHAYLGFPKIVCVLASFCLSGAAHVLILCFAQIQTGRLQWFLFFFIHGIAVCVERIVVEANVVTALYRRILSLIFMFCTLSFLFFAPLSENKIALRLLLELATGARLCSEVALFCLNRLVQLD